MSQMGAIRRIDELGRIVIPKGIRSRMRINEGDRLEITLGTTGKIEIQKYHAYHGNMEMIQSIVFALSKEIHRHVLILSEQKILASSDETQSELQEEQEIHPQLYQHLYARKTYLGRNEMILPQGKLYSFSLFPIAYNSEVLGGVLVLGEEHLSEEEMRIVHAFRNLVTTILKV